jgi:hypothetical protein
MEEQIKQANPTLHKQLFVPNKYVKYFAMFLFILLPFVGFYLGMKYQENTTVNNPITSAVQETAVSSPIPNPIDISNWNAYSGTNFTFSYPNNWYKYPVIREGPNGGFEIQAFANYPYDEGSISSRSINRFKDDYIQLQVDSNTNKDTYDFLQSIPPGADEIFHGVSFTRDVNVIHNGNTFILASTNTMSQDVYTLGLGYQIYAFLKVNQNIYTISLYAKSQQTLDENKLAFEQVLSTFKYTN